jgi:hypothetical protein
MYLSMNQETDDDALEKLKVAGKIQEYLKTEFANKYYGDGLVCCIPVLNCVSLNKTIPDFTTGTIVDKKYTKSQKYLTFSFKISYKALAKANNEEQIIELVESGILKSFAEIGKMNIAKFDFESFYKDLQEIITKRGWQHENYKPIDIPFPEELFKTKKKIPLMKEENFWELIKFSREVSKDSYDQVRKMASMLMVYPVNDVIGFEHKFRKVMQALNNYNVLALDIIMNGGTTDDGFLMFRCSIIQAGKEVFDKAINQTDNFDVTLEESHDKILGLADGVFMQKLGKDNEEELPGSICDGAEIYEDMGMTGKDWDEEDLPELFPNLWRRYKKI